MTTRQLIERLQEIDPDGNAKIIGSDGRPYTDVVGWVEDDGCTEILIA